VRVTLPPGEGRNFSELYRKADIKSLKTLVEGDIDG
jgi:hypothetical protein